MEVTDNTKTLANALAEIDQLRQKLEQAEAIIREAREQKPACWRWQAGRDEGFYFSEVSAKEGAEYGENITPLFISPVPAMPIQDYKSELAKHFKFPMESKEFEKYAIAEQMNMDMHPLHYQFCNYETSTARDAWRSAMNYAVKVLAGNQSEVKPS